MTDSDRAYWLADKIPALGDYAREASSVLREQADEIKRLRKAVEFAAHKLEGARVWSGMDWHYYPCPPHQYKPALDRLRAELRA